MAVDALLIEAVRSPLCLDSGGSFCGMTPIELARNTITALLHRAGINAGDVDRVLMEVGAEAARDIESAGLLKWPVTSLPARMPAVTIDRWCGTGQRAMHHAARSIVKGINDIVVVIGVESSSAGNIDRSCDDPEANSHRRGASLNLQPREFAAEMLATVRGITRDQLDEYAIRSHQRAAEVANAGEFDREIAPILVTRSGDEHDLLVSHDETIDGSLSVKQLKSMQPKLLDGEFAGKHPEISWSVTNGNSARHALGASALLFMSPQRAKHFGITPRARIHQFAIAQGAAKISLDAPLRATERVLASSRMKLNQFDHIEIDEEFACVPLAWQDEFTVDNNLFNPRGGALALGNARACGGIRQITTMLSALETTGGRYGLQAMGTDAGTAYAAILERS